MIKFYLFKTFVLLFLLLGANPCLVANTGYWQSDIR